MGLFAKLTTWKRHLVQQLQAANVALELHSSTDELTQLPNRRALFKQLALRFCLRPRPAAAGLAYFYRSRWFQSH